MRDDLAKHMVSRAQVEHAQQASRWYDTARLPCPASSAAATVTSTDVVYESIFE
ncbi:hypothetical protein HD597_000469 [Nonomuraea thailandensis]|uniref:Uncharacterized protein n=1 Tax=Nonomuraea thailandensis TaxID=1188745 RepID=A0A9X2G9V2_9ACTN|nr:hypothetical protein [Nonomuraea thailandensis]